MQINAVLKKHFSTIAERSLATAALDLHDIAWECQKILENVEKIGKGDLAADDVFARIIDIITGVESHIYKSHLTSLKRFARKLDSD